MLKKIGKLNVSREITDKLTIYISLLEKWNSKINLVSRSTLADISDRHIIDSAQLFSLASDATNNWVDLGSGGGFPGLVIAILSKELSPERKITLIESDQRKCVFLRTVARETNCDVTVVSERIEKISQLKADVLSARALANLPKLLNFAQLHLSPQGICLFPKGHNWEKEVEEALKSWCFEYEAIVSETSQDAVILRINEIEYA